MSNPGQQDELNACAAADAELLGQNPIAPPGWSFLQVNGKTYTTQSDSGIPNALAEGCYAVVLVNNANPDEVLVAFEDTEPGVPTYGAGSEGADLQIYSKTQDPKLPDPPAFVDAANFVATLKTAILPAGSQISVTGDELGGSEAEYAALTDGGDVTSGSSFGGTGIPGFSKSAVPAGTKTVPFINYIDFGDPVGMYGSDTKASSDYNLTSGVDHYGEIKYVGSPSSFYGFADPGEIINQLTDAGTSLAIKAEPEEIALSLSQVTLESLVMYDEVLNHHGLPHYDGDLKYSSYLNVTAAGIDPSAVMAALDAALGPSGKSDLSAAKVTGSNSIQSPNFSITVNPSQDQFSITQEQALPGIPGAQSDFGDPILFNYSPISDIVTSATYTDPNTGCVVTDTVDPTTGKVTSLTGNNQDGTSFSTIYNYDSQTVLQSDDYLSKTVYYTGSNETGLLLGLEYNYYNGSSSLTDLANDAGTVMDYSGDNGQGNLTSVNGTFQVLPDAGPSMIYSAIAADLGMAGVTGTVLAAMNDAVKAPTAGMDGVTYTAHSGDSVLPEQASVVVPIAASAPQAVLAQDGTPVTQFALPVVPAGEQSLVSYAAVLNVDAGTVTFLAVPTGSEAANTVYLVDGQDNLLNQIQRVSFSATTPWAAATPYTNGDGFEFPNMPAYVMIEGSGDYVVPVADFKDATQYGQPVTPQQFGYVANNTSLTLQPYVPPTALTGGAQTATGVAVAAVNGTDDAPDYGYNISVGAGNKVLVSGNSGSGYSGSATLSNVYELELGGAVYDLDVLPASGGASSFVPIGYYYGQLAQPVGSIVAEGSGAPNTITVTGDTYWHVNTQGDQITVEGAGNEFYLPGPSTAYTVVYNQAAAAVDVYAGNGQNGTPTVFTIYTAGSEVNFTDGVTLGLGDTGDAIEYLGSSGSANLEDDGNQTIHGASGNTAYFQDGDPTPDGAWNIQADASGDVIFNGADAGYDGTVTLNGLTRVVFETYPANGGTPTPTTYALLTTPNGGGALTVNSGNTGGYPAIVAEQAGTTNTITFSDSASINYWNVTGKNDTATLDAYYDYVYMPDALADYAIAYNTSGGVMTLTDLGAGGSGTTTLSCPGYPYTAAITFADGSVLSLNAAADVYFSSGNVQFGASSDAPGYQWQIAETAAGAIAFNGANDGYDGAYTITGTPTVQFGGVYYYLTKLTAAGGQTLTIGNYANEIVAEDAGNNKLTFSNTAGVTYWHVNGAGDKATLSAGRTEIVMRDPMADYTIASTGGVVTLSDSVANSNGTTTITLGNGSGDVQFADGQDLWLGQYVYIVALTGTTMITGQGTHGGDYATFFDVTSDTLGAAWAVTQNAGGQAVIASQPVGSPTGGSGFMGTVTLADIQGVSVGGLDYDLVVLPHAGGTATIATPTDGAAGTAVVEGAGGDTLSFTSTGNNAWHVAGANDTATLTAGYTEIDMTGNAADYTITSNGTTLTLVDGVANRNGTTTLHLGAGTGDLVFADGGDIGLSTSVVASTTVADLSYDLTAGGTLSVTGAGDIVTLSAGMATIQMEDPAADYTVTYDGAQTVTLVDSVAGRNGTTTFDLAGGSAQLTFASGMGIGLGTSTGDTVNYGGLGQNIFTLTGTATVHGSSQGANLAVLSGSTGPGTAWSMTDNGGGTATIAGSAGTGFTGTATLIAVGQVELGGTVYDLTQAPDTGATTVATPLDGSAGTIVTEQTGGNAYDFASGDPTYWYASGANDTATLDAGVTEIYFSGAGNQYTETYDGTGTVTVKKTATGATDTVTIAAGSGELVFASGSSIGLGTGATGDGAEFGGVDNDTFTLTSQSAAIYGGGGTDTVVFSSTAGGPGKAWTIAENAAGQVIVTAPAAGYTGTSKLASIEQLGIGGKTYALIATPNAGGATTIGTPGAGLSGTIVAEGAGADALTFSGSGVSYWHVGGGSNTATLAAGTTEIYFAGAASQYSETFNGTNLVTVTKIATGATEKLSLSGGSGELVFASGSNIGLNKSGDTVIYGGSTAATLTGTAGSDALYAGSGTDTFVGDGGTDTYYVGAGTTTETIVNGVASSNVAAGNLDFTGAIDASNLWLQKSGNNLVIDVLGTTRQTVMQNWYATGDAFAQTSEIVSADALKLDSALNSLVTAMATFSAGHATFNPQTTTDTTLTNAAFYGTLSATDKSSWHS